MLRVSWYLENAIIQQPIAVIIHPTDPSLWQYSRATDIYIDRVTSQGTLEVCQATGELVQQAIDFINSKEFCD